MADTGPISQSRQVIAVVDDEPRVLRSLKRLLDAVGFSTSVFESGEQFLESVDTAKADCVVLDINLGGMSGLETRRALSSKGYAVPVIFMTALDTAAVRREAVASGCAAYLQKPFSGHRLVDAIRSATAGN